MRRSRLLPVLLLLAGSLPLRASGPTLVKDVDPSPAVSSDHQPLLGPFVSVGSRAVFVLLRTGPQDYGGELWASDGTDGGTALLRSFVNSQSAVQILGSDGRIAFALITTYERDFTQSFTVWRTDGTADGTFAVTGPLGLPPGGFQTLVTAGRLFFPGCTADSGCEPWVSDGSAAGTRRLRDLTPGPYGSGPRQFVAMGGKVWFFADTPAGPGLWQTDGTRPGTRRVALLSPFANPKALVAAGSRLYFLVGPPPGYVGGALNALWTSDGTGPGTRSVPPFTRARERGPAAAQLLGSSGGLEYFVGIDPAVGWQVYRTDGTPGGTLRLTSFSGAAVSIPFAAPLDGGRFLFLGPGGGFLISDGTRAGTVNLGGPTPESHSGIVARDGQVFFNARINPGGQGYEPWVTDGTAGGTQQVADLCPGACSSFPLFFGPVIHGEVLFYARGSLWGTDGTAGGTRLLATGATAPTETQQAAPLVAAAGSCLVFAGFEQDAANNVIPELKSTEGTPESERTLDLRLTDGAGSNPRGFTALGDKVLFFACSPQGGAWSTGGTPETTVPLAGAGNVCGDTSLHFVVLNGIAYFKAIKSGDYWHELWRTDGTPEGTYAVTQMGPEQEVNALAVLQGKLLLVTSFLDNDPTKVHSAVWTSDGTTAGTAQVFDLAVRYVREIQLVGDVAYFVGQNADYQTAVYRSDGTRAGTRELTRIGLDAQAVDFQQLGGQTFFLVRDRIDGMIYRTDGTPEGTLQLVPPGNPVSYIQDLVQFGGRLYFFGLDVTDPEGYKGQPTLFRSDGTTAGTVRVRSFSNDNDILIPYFLPPRFVVAGGTLYFVAADEAHGSELWRSDGTTSGTVLVKDIRPGPDGSRISAIAAAGNRIFLAADDGEHGVELWTSDGTAAGTRQAADLSEGPTSSAPAELSPLGSRLFFSADDGVVGREPWMLPLDATLAGRIVP